MRRKMKSNISFFLVFMVASFTLLSYIFDQLAIGQEDRLRMQIINQSNLDAKINHIDSTYNQILDIHNSNNKIIEKSLKLRNIWIKSYLIINSKEKKDSGFNKFFLNTKSSEKNIIMDNLIMDFIRGMRDNYYFCEKISNIYSRIDFFIDKKKYSSKCVGLYKTIIKSYTNELNNSDVKYSNFLEDSVWKEDKFNNITKTFNEGHWLDVNFLTLMLIKYFDEANIMLTEDLDKLDNEYNDLNEKKKLNLEKIKNLSSMKNYFILLSIITQILSLLSLLFFFRNLLLKNSL
jgi:hypothetical protein